MLCWSRHFAFWSHYIAVLLRWENSSCPHNSMHTQNFRNKLNLSHLSNCSLRSDINICIGISCLFQGQDFIPSWISRAILEVKRISLCSPAWSFLTVCAQQRKLLVLAHTRAERLLPRNQLTVFILLIHYWKLFLQLHSENKGIAVVTFNFTDRTGRIFWESFFFCLFSLHKFHKTCLPSSNFFLNIWVYGECVETLLLSCCSNGPS